MFFLREERIKQRSYNNSFLHLVEVTNNKKGLLYPLCWAFGPRYRKLLFVVWHFIYTLLSLLISYPCFHSYVCRTMIYTLCQTASHISTVFLLISYPCFHSYVYRTHYVKLHHTYLLYSCSYSSYMYCVYTNIMSPIV